MAYNELILNWDGSQPHLFVCNILIWHNGHLIIKKNLRRLIIVHRIKLTTSFQLYIKILLLSLCLVSLLKPLNSVITLNVLSFTAERDTLFMFLVFISIIYYQDITFFFTMFIIYEKY